MHLLMTHECCWGRFSKSYITMNGGCEDAHDDMAGVLGMLPTSRASHLGGEHCRVLMECDTRTGQFYLHSAFDVGGPHKSTPVCMLELAHISHDPLQQCAIERRSPVPRVPVNFTIHQNQGYVSLGWISERGMFKHHSNNRLKRHSAMCHWGRLQFSHFTLQT